MAQAQGINEATLKKFEEKFGTLPSDVQFAIRDLIAEINQGGLFQTGGCPWRVSQTQFGQALPVLQIISPSIAGEFQKNEYTPAFRVTWTANDFIVPDLNNLEEAFSPISVGEPGPLCRSTSGDDYHSSEFDDAPLCRTASAQDWCITPKSVPAGDDCPSSNEIPETRRHQPDATIPTWGEVTATKSAGDDWCVTPKSVPAGDDCPSSAYAEDETPMYYGDDCPSSYGGRR